MEAAGPHSKCTGEPGYSIPAQMTESGSAADALKVENTRKLKEVASAIGTRLSGVQANIALLSNVDRTEHPSRQAMLLRPDPRC